MKFIVSSSYLLKQLQVLGSVINSSNTLPILDNFLFELDNNQLIVSASDLETTMSATLEIDSKSEGSVAVPAKLLLEILNPRQKNYNKMRVLYKYFIDVVHASIIQCLSK